MPPHGHNTGSNYGSASNAFSLFSSSFTPPILSPQAHQTTHGIHHNTNSIPTASQLHAHAIAAQVFSTPNNTGAGHGNGNGSHAMSTQWTNILQGLQGQASANITSNQILANLAALSPKAKDKKEKVKGKERNSGKAARILEDGLKREVYTMDDFVRDVVEAFGLEGVMGMRGPGEVEGEVEAEVEEEEGYEMYA